MKTAISVPDRVSDRVERRAKELGMSRSEFYSRAAESYLGELDRDDLTARMNAAIAASGAAVEREQSESARFGLSTLAAQTANDDWSVNDPRH